MDADDLDWLLQEHEGLEELLPRLWQALGAIPPDLGKVASCVETLATELPVHIESEEEVVLPWLRERLPRATASVDLLRMEHRQLLDALATVGRMVREGSPALVESGRVLVRLLWQHARAERLLLERALALQPPP